MRLIRFHLPADERFISGEEGEALAFLTEENSSGGERSFTLSVRLRSDYADAPLSLTAEGIRWGEEAALLIHPWRIELWAGGCLADEEWPCGRLYAFEIPAEELEAAGFSVLDDPEAGDDANLALRAADYATDCGISANESAPAVIGTLTGGAEEGTAGIAGPASGCVKRGNPAEGWKPADPGVFAGDCMPYTDVDPDGRERYHVLYLKDRRHHCSKWHRGAHQWAHMSTTDFSDWQLHPLSVSIDDPAEGSICTGSWLKTDEGVHYLYYTVRPIDDSPAPLMRSVSEDGYHYRRDPGFRIELSPRYHGNSARDPKIVRAEDGYHMFVTTSLMTGEDAGKGCLAHLTSPDGVSWTEGGPIYIAPDGDQPECSDYFVKDGWHYLIFSHHGSGQYRFSREPFSGWQCPEDPSIPCESVPKMALFHGRIIFTGFHRIEGYAGTLTFSEAWQNPDGTLRFSL